MKTTNMRVPIEFRRISLNLAKKRGYKSNTLFLKTEGVRILKNADVVNDVIDMFRSSKKKRRLI